MKVSNLIWEIRRCRRCELMTDNWIRYWDLVRWHQLDKIDTSVYTDVNRGANLPAMLPTFLSQSMPMATSFRRVQLASLIRNITSSRFLQGRLR